MRALPLATLTVVLAWVAGCSSTKPPDPATLDAQATARLQAIPAALPEKYRDMKDLKNWRNPYLVILPEGIGLLDPENNEQHVLKPEEVLRTLAGLPPSAWPYGRVVALTESSGSSEPQRIAIRRNKGIVAATLQDAHVLINWGPSS